MEEKKKYTIFIELRSPRTESNQLLVCNIIRPKTSGCQVTESANVKRPINHDCSLRVDSNPPPVLPLPQKKSKQTPQYGRTHPGVEFAGGWQEPNPSIGGVWVSSLEPTPNAHPVAKNKEIKIQPDKETVRRSPKTPFPVCFSVCVFRPNFQKYNQQPVSLCVPLHPPPQPNMTT